MMSLHHRMLCRLTQQSCCFRLQIIQNAIVRTTKKLREIGAFFVSVHYSCRVPSASHVLAFFVRVAQSEERYGRRFEPCHAHQFRVFPVTKNQRVR